MTASTPTPPPQARNGTWGRLGVYLIGVAIGLVLLATFKMMSWKSAHPSGQTPAPSAPAGP